MSFFKNESEFRYEFDSEITVRSKTPFCVEYVDPETGEVYIVGPDSSNDRVWRGKLSAGQTLILSCDSDPFVHVERAVDRFEKSDPIKIVEEIPDDVLSFEDRMRLEMLHLVSEIAGKNNLETFEEASDFSFADDDDSDTPFTPYEFEDMKEDFLNDSTQPKPNRESPEGVVDSEPAPPAPVTTATKGTEPVSDDA